MTRNELVFGSIQRNLALQQTNKAKEVKELMKIYMKAYESIYTVNSKNNLILTFLKPVICQLFISIARQHIGLHYKYP